MKAATKKLFAMILVMAVLLGAFAVNAFGAETFQPEGDPLTYTVLDESTVEVSGCASGETAITIPATVGDYTVVSIKDKLFNNYEDLETLTFADGCMIEVINNNFNYCTDLKTISWGEDTALSKIDLSFRGCAALEELTVPASVKTIGELSFSNCMNLSELTFEEGSQLQTIEKEAFAFMGKDDEFVPAVISQLTLPASLETLEEGAFHCIPVEHFALENGSALTEIPDGFLSADGADGQPGVKTECTSLWDYIEEWFVALLSPYPQTPKTVAEACDSLITIDLGEENSLKRIGMGAFKNQTHLTDIEFGEAADGVKLTIARGAFIAAGNNGVHEDEELGGIDTLVFPANLVKMEGSAFNFARIKNMEFSRNCQLAVIEDAFMEIGMAGNNGHPGVSPVQIGANALESVDFGKNNSLTKIGSGTFKNQSHLTSIEFGSSDEELHIKAGAFIGVGNNGHLVAEGVDSKLSEGIETLVLPANLVELSWGAFDAASVQNLVFSDNCQLSSIPDGFMAMKEAGNNGRPGDFYDDPYFIEDPAQIASLSLKTIKFGKNNSLTQIGSGAFKNQGHLTSIDFGTSDEDLVLNSGAFIGAGNNAYLVEHGVDSKLNSGIETLVFPENLSSMSYGCFDTARIKNIVFSDNCQLSSIPSNFMGLADAGCNGYPGRIYDGGSESYVFKDDPVQLACNCLESVRFGKNNSLEYINSGAFKNQSHLTEIDFGTPKNELNIGSGVFIGVGNNGYLVEQGIDDELCEGIETLVLPANVKSLESGDFEYAKIRNLVISDDSKLTTIPSGFMGIQGTGSNGYPGRNHPGEEGFAKDLAQLEANSLESIVFGKNNSLANIGYGAFKNQSHVTELDFGSSDVELTINSGAFIGIGNNGYLVEMGVDDELCDGIETLVLPANVKSIDTGDFGFAKIKNFVISDNSKLTSIPSGFMGVDGAGCNAQPGYGVKGSYPNTEIGFIEDLAQQQANSLESIVFGEDNSLANIGYGAFKNQSHVTELDFGSSDVELALEYGAFIGIGNNAYLVENGVDDTLCEGIETLVLPANLKTLTPGDFDFAAIHNLVISDDSKLTSIPNGFMQIGGEDGVASTETSRVGANVLESVNFGNNNSLTNIGYGAFHYQSNLSEITFGKNANGDELNLCAGAFQGLASLEELTLDADCGVKTLQGGVFSDCNNLTTVDLLNSNITVIDDCLKNNKKLTTVIFPKTLEEITWSQKEYDEEKVKRPFAGCGSVTAMYFSSTAPNGYKFADEVFDGLMAEHGVIYVSAATSDANIEKYRDIMGDTGMTVDEVEWSIQPLDHNIVKVEAVDANCLESGTKAHYVCTDEDCGKHFSDQVGINELKEEDWFIPAGGHKCSDVTYTWSKDLSKCTASATCDICGETITEDGVVTSEITTPATATKKGVKTYTAVFTDDLFKTQTKTETLPATGKGSSGSGSSSESGSGSSGTPAPVVPAGPAFVDVPAGTYYSDAVAWAVANGITNGTSDTTFSPNKTCTRAQAVTFLWRAAGSPKAAAVDTFADVVKGSYYEEAVAWAVANGITDGTSKTTFSPNAECTRAQIVTFLWRAAGKPAASGSVFKDVVSGSYYEQAVAWAVANGITEGTSASTFSPNAGCTRAQIVTFLYRSAK